MTTMLRLADVTGHRQSNAPVRAKAPTPAAKTTRGAWWDQQDNDGRNDAEVNPCIRVYGINWLFTMRFRTE
jgi:hypothetical protein